VRSSFRAARDRLDSRQPVRFSLGSFDHDDLDALKPVPEPTVSYSRFRGYVCHAPLGSGQRNQTDIRRPTAISTRISCPRVSDALASAVTFAMGGNASAFQSAPQHLGIGPATGPVLPSRTCLLILERRTCLVYRGALQVEWAILAGNDESAAKTEPLRSRRNISRKPQQPTGRLMAL